MKRLFSMILVLLMLTLTLVACRVDTSTDHSTNPSASQENSGASSDVKTDLSAIDKNDTDEKGYQNDRLPKEIDYEGRSISLLTWRGNEALTYPQEAGDGGDPIQESLYYHWRSIEERLGIVFSPTYVGGYWNDMEEFMTTARAEDAAYDLIQTESLFPTTLAQEGRLANLRNQAYPDFAMPWWPDSVDEWTQYGSLFFICSNSSANSISNLIVMFAHLGMIEEEGLGDPVKLALRGGWTIEEFGYYSKQFAGLAEANPGEIYGFVVDDNSRVDALYYGAGFNSTRNNSQGVAELAFDDAAVLEKLSNAADLYANIFRGVETKIYVGDNATALYDQTTALFLGFMHYIRNVEETTAYAVLPLPKYDSSQKNYCSVHRDCTDMWCVPISTLDKELCGIILEANASSEYRNIAPFYFEQYLMKRYSNSAEGMKCFELLRDSVIYDFGKVSVLSGIEAGSFFRSCFGSGAIQNTIMSRYSSTIESYRNNLRKVLNDYETYKNN